MWGLSTDLRLLVFEGLAAAVEAGRAASEVHARAEFERRRDRAKAATLDLIGFGLAAPLRPGDRKLLAARMLLEEGELECGREAGELYRVSDVLERTRNAMGKKRRSLVKGTLDPERCFYLMGMATTQRPTVSTLRGILHAAWRSDSIVQADVLAARWPLGVAGRDRRAG